MDYYYRDLAGFDVNPDMRAKAGKDMSFIPPWLGQNHLHPQRAKLIEKSVDYLLNSNFYALRMALNGTPYEISKEWVESQVIKILEAEIILGTGREGETLATLKGALTKYMREDRPYPGCSTLISKLAD